jgi:CRISPR/Cas system CSM-associated protein Csm3 (group 7 of RAMP superfamily)
MEDNEMAQELGVYTLKGEKFVNRYRIAGTLTTQSPLHIGTGSRRPDEGQSGSKSASDGSSKSEEQHLVDEIACDFKGHPYIPGSSLRGVIRHYLFQVFRGIDGRIARPVDFEDKRFREMKQNDQINYMKNEASLLERVFGTPFCESKIETWDAYLINAVQSPAEHLKDKGWDNAKQSYVIRSVAIDPETGAAEPNKLYSFEVVPPGAKFKVDILGQNLSDEEIGFLLFGFHGFNSEIYPVTLGAMSGRGFGRLSFEVNSIYYLDAKDMSPWVKVASQLNHAGYDLFSKMQPADAKKLVPKFKSAIESKIRV